MSINRLTEIDELTRLDHHYLSSEDACFYLGEYTARAGFSHSDTNQLIHNLKISPKHRGSKRWYYKEQAILTAGRAFRRTIQRDWVENSGVLVPIPPSKAKGHPLFDPRMHQVLTTAFQGYNSDIRELVVQIKSTEADHEADERIDLDELLSIYEVDDKLREPIPTQIALVDDVLTTGKHFKAAKSLLQETFPGCAVVGLFVARVIHDADVSMFADVSD